MLKSFCAIEADCQPSGSSQRSGYVGPSSCLSPRWISELDAMPSVDQRGHFVEFLLLLGGQLWRGFLDNLRLWFRWRLRRLLGFNLGVGCLRVVGEEPRSGVDEFLTQFGVGERERASSQGQGAGDKAGPKGSFFTSI